MTATPNIIAGQILEGKNYIRLGKAYANKNGRRKGFTARLPIHPTGSRIVIFQEDGGEIGTEGTQMAVYAVTGKTQHRSRENTTWESFGSAKITHKGKAIEVIFDRIPPSDPEGHMVFSILERQVGDSDHQETQKATEEFLDLIFSDLYNRNKGNA